MHCIYLNPGNLGRSTQLTSTFYELEVGFASWQHKLHRMHLFLGRVFHFFQGFRFLAVALSAENAKIACRNKEQLQSSQRENGKLKDALRKVTRSHRKALRLQKL